MAFLLRMYGRALERSPVLTNSTSAFILYGSGDCLAQNIERMMNVESPKKKQYNYERTARMCIFGAAIAGPVLTSWYSLLHRMTSVFRYEYVAMTSSSNAGWLSSMGSMYRKDVLEGIGNKNKEVILKVVLDQLLFQAPFLNVYLMSMSLLEGMSFRAGLERCKQNFHDAWGYSLIFWGPSQFVNFSFVPVHLAPLAVNFLSLVWNAFLSVLFHHRDYGEVTVAVQTEISLSSGEDTLDDPMNYQAVVKRFSSFAGRALQSCAAAAADAGDELSKFSSKLAVARRAAQAAWSLGQVPVLASEQLLQEQQQLVADQHRELERLRRTVTYQAVQIQLLEEETAAEAKSLDVSFDAGGDITEPSKLREQLVTQSRQLADLLQEVDALRRTVATQAIRLGEYEELSRTAPTLPPASMISERHTRPSVQVPGVPLCPSPECGDQIVQLKEVLLCEESAEE